MATPVQAYTEFGRERRKSGAYQLNLNHIWEYPAKVNGEESTFGKAYLLLKGNVDLSDSSDRALDVDYILKSGQPVEVQTHIHLSSLLERLVELSMKAEPESCMWYYYQHDWSRDADEIFQFFVVNDQQIVQEYFSLGSFDPAVLEFIEKDKDPIWHSGPYFSGAVDKYYYNKFYTETYLGQLMVLRSDEPALFHFERSSRQDVLRPLQTVYLVRCYKLLWVIGCLLAARLVPQWSWLFIVAALGCLANLLLYSWHTRNIGQD
jgi:hypothetical protein